MDASLHAKFLRLLLQEGSPSLRVRGIWLIRRSDVAEVDPEVDRAARRVHF